MHNIKYQLLKECIRANVGSLFKKILSIENLRNIRGNILFLGDVDCVCTCIYKWPFDHCAWRSLTHILMKYCESV